MKRLLPAGLLLSGAAITNTAMSMKPPATTTPLAAKAGASEPFAYGPWRSSKIGGGGYLQNVVLCPSDPKRLYVYVDVGGVYRSDDGGTRWRMMNRTLPKYAVRGLVVDPRDANRVVIAVGDQWDGGAAGLLESRDGGENWTLTQKANFYGNENYRMAGVVLARDPRNPDVLVAAAGEGVFRSTDGGTRWAKTTGAGGLFPSDLKWDRRGTRLHLCAQPEKAWRDGQLAGGYYVSEDGGKTWAKAADKAPREMAQDPKNPDRWYALVDSPARVQVSDDNGKTWADFAQGLPPVGDTGAVSDSEFDAFTCGPDFLLLGSRKGTVWRRGLADPVWTKIERAGVTEVYEGEPWYGKMEPGKWQHFGSAMGSLVVDPRDARHWFFTDWYALYQTRDAGKNWTLTIDGVEVTVLHCLTQDPSDPKIVHLGMADNGYLRSTDGGARFRAGHVTSNMKCVAVSPANPARVYGVGDGIGGKWESNTAFRSDDRGATWRRSPMTGLPDLKQNHANSIAVHPADPDRVYVAVAGKVGPGSGGVYRSGDGGQTWAWMGPGLPDGKELFQQDIWSIGREVAVDGAGNLVAVSTNQKRAYLFEAASGRWSEAKDFGALRGNPRSVVADPKAPGRFLVGAAQAGVWETRDAGRTWRRVLDKEAEHVALDAANPRRVLAGTSEGIAYSADGGATWRMLDARLPMRANKLVCFAGDRVLVGTGGGGAFWSELPK